MSEFWNASAPPATADFVAWCEDNVEAACTDLASNVRLMGYYGVEKRTLLAYSYPGGDWDDGLEFPKAEKPLSCLLIEGADGFLRYLQEDARHGIYGPDIQTMEAALKEIEEAIKAVRDLYQSDELPS